LRGVLWLCVSATRGWMARAMRPAVFAVPGLRSCSPPCPYLGLPGGLFFVPRWISIGDASLIFFTPSSFPLHQIRKVLCDKDPSVMGASLALFLDLASECPQVQIWLLSVRSDVAFTLGLDSCNAGGPRVP
jgi:hypothetical protein